MLNLFDIPKPQNGFVSVFPGFSGASPSTQWVTWEKPAGITMIRIICIGGGGGGSSGFPSATVTARGGGGGGGSGAFTTVEIPAYLLPDTLYVSPGAGGNGGASSTTVSNLGSNGSTSIVSIAPRGASIYNVCLGASGSGPTVAASATVVGGGGAAGSATAFNGAHMAGLGIISSIAGNLGNAGGAVANGSGSSVSFPTTGLLLSGGAGGGGGSNGTGGNISVPTAQTADLSLYTQINGGAAGATPGNGSPGVERKNPLLSTGGSGGGANSGNARGGDGGDGGFGSGGGGGGAGGTTGGGGAGGNGGPGLVIIYSW